MRTFVLNQLKTTILYVAILLALTLVFFSVYTPIENHQIRPYIDIVALAICLLITSPFLWALGFKHDLDTETEAMVMKNKANRQMVWILYAVRFVASWFITSYIFRHFLDDEFWCTLNVQMDDVLMAIVASLAFLLLLKGLSPAMKWYERIESRFLENMNKRESMQSFVVPELLQENFALEKMLLSPKSSYAGRRIRDCDFRRTYNAIVVGVDRADEVIDLPMKDLLLFPSDEITFVGTEEQLAKLKPFVEVEDDVLIKERPRSDVDIHKIVVDEGNPFLDITLRESDFRHVYNAMVIAVERDDNFLLNPSAETLFQKGDTIWYVASEAKAKELARSVKTGQLKTEN